MSKKIDPFCKVVPGAFIEFTGLLAPCCWLISTKNRHNLLENYMGEDYKRLFITNTREDIINVYRRIEDSWETDEPYLTCLDVCGVNVAEHPLKRRIQDQNPSSAESTD